MASVRSKSLLVTSKINKIKSRTILRAGLTFYFFNKKTAKKSWRAYNSTIKRIVCIMKQKIAKIFKKITPLTRPVGCKDCNKSSSRQFESPSRSLFVIFLVEYRGLEIKILISGAPKSLQPNFLIHVLILTFRLFNFVINFAIVCHLRIRSNHNKGSEKLIRLF